MQNRFPKFSGLFAIIVTLIGLAVRKSFVAGDQWPTSSNAKAEFAKVTEALNSKPALKRTAGSQRSHDAEQPAIPAPEQPKVIEIEYDGNGKAIVHGADNEPERPDGAPNKPDRHRAAAGQSYRNDDWHFSIAIPWGWQEMSPGELKAMNQGARTLGFGSQVKYQAGFRRRKTKPGTYPYILVAAKAGKLGSYEEAEHALETQLPKSVKQAEGALKNVADNISIKNVGLDRESNRISFGSQVDVQGVGPVQASSVGHLGSNGVVFVHCYARAHEFDAWLATFERLNDSFNYDDGFAFVERDSGSIFDQLAAFSTQKWWKGAAVGGGAGAAVGLATLLFRRPRRKASPITCDNDQHPDPILAELEKAAKPFMACTNEPKPHGGLLNDPDDSAPPLTAPPSTAAVATRLLSWIITIAAVSLGGYWTWQHGPGLVEQWPEIKQQAASWCVKQLTGITPEDVMANAEEQLRPFKK